MDVCRMRTGYFEMRPEHREPNGVPDGPLPHVFGSTTRHLMDGEWVEVERHCSWCGKVGA